MHCSWYIGFVITSIQGAKITYRAGKRYIFWSLGTYMLLISLSIYVFSQSEVVHGIISMLYSGKHFNRAEKALPKETSLLFTRNFFPTIIPSAKKAIRAASFASGGIPSSSKLIRWTVWKICS